MKKDIHPTYQNANIRCTTCGNEFEAGSILKEVKVDTCANCHPFYTGKLTSNSKAGRIERFNNKFAKKA